ncbi:stage III sporulation protein AD [Caminicella sporogenes]|uniref:stage III sporulation protein AD n=1 Tax=Caminicella sporogenes TaxID=166485 RepID=UPI0025424176|nr:stage III sporulation protein AD [Caminicella sporogenes]WIF94533.1 stage III sporulation protein AD [Caminicella sporogenes]
MEIFKIVGLGIIATILTIVVKQYKPEYGVHISIAAGVMIFLMIAGKLVSVFEVINQLTDKLEIDLVYVKSIFKIIGIAYISEFGAQICRDSGEEAIAFKVELGGKIIIMVLALPILLSVFNLITKLML